MIRPILVRDVSTKIGPLGDVLRTLCAGWITGKHQDNRQQCILHNTNKVYVRKSFHALFTNELTQQSLWNTLFHLLQFELSFPMEYKRCKCPNANVHA